MKTVLKKKDSAGKFTQPIQFAKYFATKTYLLITILNYKIVLFSNVVITGSNGGFLQLFKYI